MKKHYHVSEYFLCPSQAHENLAFVDVNLCSDNRVFIDPALVETNSDEWSKQANRYLQSYMDCLNEAFRTDDHKKKHYLLSEAREQNAIKFGYGSNGNNGHGNTDSGLDQKFSGLSDWAKKIGPLRAVDVSLLVKDFAEDGMSDWLAHILAKPLAEFTREQCRLYHQDLFSEQALTYWDSDVCCWKTDKYVLPTYNGKLLLLVPKQIVRKRLITSTGHFLQHVILSREQEKTRYVDEKGNEHYSKTKNELKAQIPKDEDGGYTRYVNEYINKHTDTLGEYHDYLIAFCSGRTMSDAELDELYLA